MPAFLVHRFSRGFLKFVLFFRPSRSHSQARGGFITKSMPETPARRQPAHPRPACFPVFVRFPRPMRTKEQPYVKNHCAACACLRIHANKDKQLLCVRALGNSMPCIGVVFCMFSLNVAPALWRSHLLAIFQECAHSGLRRSHFCFFL